MLSSLFIDHAKLLPTVKMGYEDSVYLAKLAEQAERYDGESFLRALNK